MLKTRIFAVLLSCWGLSCFVTAQLDTNRFALTIKPPPGTNIVTESTNLLTLSISNYLMQVISTTNDADGAEITVTNMVPVLSNLTVFATFPTNGGTNLVRINLADRGNPPDLTNNDGIFTGTLITPYTATGFTLPLTFTMRGIDTSRTNDAGEVQESPFTNQFVVEYLIIPRPPNDKFTNAFKISPGGGISITTNNYASVELNEPLHANVAARDASIWWMWSSPVSTNVLIDTAGSSFSTVLAVYTGTNVAKTQLKEVASSAGDSANKLNAHVNFDAVAGVTYRIVVCGKDSTTNGVGSVRLRVAPGAVADTHAPLVSIDTPTRETITTTDVITITGSAKEPFPNDSGISNILIRVGSGPLTNAIGLTTWSATITLPAGTNVVSAYAVDFAGNIGPSDSIVIRYINPTNDLFTSVGWLPGVGGIVTANNQLATIEPGEPLHAGNVGGHSVWYSWRAPGDGQLLLSTSGSTFDTLLDLYVGTNLTNMVEVSYNDDAYDTTPPTKYSELVFGVVSNQLYYISVDGYGGDSGTITLQYAFVAPQAGQYYNLVISSSPGGRVSPPSGSYRSGSRATLIATPDPNFEFAGWLGDIQSLNNPLTLSMSQDYTIKGSFRLIVGTNAPVTDGFESGDFRRLNWSSQGNSSWRVQTNVVSRGKFAAQSGPVGNGQTNALIIKTNFLAGTGSFDVKVSSEEEWDFLEFRLNGKLLQRWSGEVAWTNFVFTVPFGNNTLMWSYIKDPNFSSGDDTAYLDNVFLPLDNTKPVGGPADLRVSVRSNGQMQITMLCDPDLNYTIEASPDLYNWLQIYSGSSPSGIIQFLDKDAPSYSSRYYRATTP